MQFKLDIESQSRKSLIMSHFHDKKPFKEIKLIKTLPYRKILLRFKRITLTSKWCMGCTVYFSMYGSYCLLFYIGHFHFSYTHFPSHCLFFSMGYFPFYYPHHCLSPTKVNSYISVFPHVALFYFSHSPSPFQTQL